MAISYVIRKFKNQGSEYNGMYFAQVKVTDTIELKTLSERIQRNCTAKRSDVLAVLTELVEAITDSIQNGEAVKIAGLGTFKPCLRGTFAPDLASFNANANIKSLGVNFTPEWTTDSSGKRIVPLVSGARIKEYEEYKKT